MKRFILFSILSVLFYSAPGHTGLAEGEEEAPPPKPAAKAAQKSPRAQASEGNKAAAALYAWAEKEAAPWEEIKAARAAAKAAELGSPKAEQESMAEDAKSLEELKQSLAEKAAERRAAAAEAAVKVWEESLAALSKAAWEEARVARDAAAQAKPASGRSSGPYIYTRGNLLSDKPMPFDPFEQGSHLLSRREHQSRKEAYELQKKQEEGAPLSPAEEAAVKRKAREASAPAAADMAAAVPGVAVPRVVVTTPEEGGT